MYTFFACFSYVYSLPLNSPNITVIRILFILYIYICTRVFKCTNISIICVHIKLLSSTDEQLQLNRKELNATQKNLTDAMVELQEQKSRKSLSLLISVSFLSLFWFTYYIFYYSLFLIWFYLQLIFKCPLPTWCSVSNKYLWRLYDT